MQPRDSHTEKGCFPVTLCKETFPNIFHFHPSFKEFSSANLSLLLPCLLILASSLFLASSGLKKKNFIQSALVKYGNALIPPNFAQNSFSCLVLLPACYPNLLTKQTHCVFATEFFSPLFKHVMMLHDLLSGFAHAVPFAEISFPHLLLASATQY